jgi:hypothetical protein
VKDAIADAVNRALDRKPAVMKIPPPNPMDLIIPKPPSVTRPEFSVIVCSVNDDKFKCMSAAYAVALSGEPYEVIRITDAKGLAEGYLRGLQQSVGKYIIFSHDDAAPIRPIGAKLRRHLSRVDIVGGAGSDRLDGPAWFTAGPPHTFGQVLNQVGVNTPQGVQIQYLLSVYGVPNRLVENIQVIDGFWMACNRSILAPDRAWFDTDTCPGFHGYDIDFSFSAFKRGVRIGVASDLSLCHASTGGYGDVHWKFHADKLTAKHGESWSQHKPLTWQFTSVVGTDQALMLEVMDGFVEKAHA